MDRSVYLLTDAVRNNKTKSEVKTGEEGRVEVNPKRNKERRQAD